MKIHNTYLLLGGNLGDRLNNLNKTLLLIEKYIGRIISRSSVYETAPWGFKCDKMFLNQLVCVETRVSPRELLSHILKIETMMGRMRKANLPTINLRQAGQWDDRIIDIDILFYDEVVLNEEELKIPHPYLHQRRFALVPLAEIVTNMVHPGLNKTIGQLLEECTDNLEVKIFNSKFQSLKVK